MNDLMFRVLSEEDKADFIQWADDNEHEARYNKVGVYHPVIIQRWKDKGLMKEQRYGVISNNGLVFTADFEKKGNLSESTQGCNVNVFDDNIPVIDYSTIEESTVLTEMVLGWNNKYYIEGIEQEHYREKKTLQQFLEFVKGLGCVVTNSTELKKRRQDESYNSSRN